MSLKLRFISFVAAVVISIVAAAAAHADNGLSSLTSSLTTSSLATSLIGGNCGSTATVFSPWSDARSYYFTADGGFEAGGSGWTLGGGAKVVAANESFKVHSATDSHALLIPSGGSALSPSLCFGLLYPGVRMFASGTGTLHVQVIAHGLLGGLTTLDGGTTTVGAAWAPTPVFSTLLSNLNVPVGTKSVQLELTSTGNVTVDDIYIDPFVSR